MAWFVAAAGSEAVDQTLNTVIARAEGVLAENCALCLIVQLQMDPVDGVVALAFFGPADELTPQARPCRLWWVVHRLGDGRVGHHVFDAPGVLELVEDRTGTSDVVVLQVHQRDAGVTQFQPVAGHVCIQQ